MSEGKSGGFFSGLARLIKYGLFSFLGLIVLVMMFGGRTKSTESSVTTTADRPQYRPPGSNNIEAAAPAAEPAPAPAVTLPVAQATLADIVADFAVKYPTLPNELKKSALRLDRRAKIAAAVPNKKAVDWVGRLKRMSTGSHGDAYVVIEIPGTNIALTNHSLKAIFDDFEIKPKSKLYEAVSELAVGDTVLVSGKFLEGELDFIGEDSMREEGAMTHPEFIIKYEAIKKYEPAAH